MSSIPDWLTEASIARTEALGREMALFLRRRHEQEANGDATVEPHRELLDMIEALRAKERRRTAAGGGVFDD